MNIMADMWTRLEQHQTFADQRGYGAEWRRMCEQRTATSAEVAHYAAREYATREVTWAAAHAAGRAAEALYALEEAAHNATDAVRFMDQEEGK